MAFLLFVALAGCSAPVLSGTKITLEQIQFIEPGKTGRAEVEQNFGRPMWLSEDGRVAAYFWRTGVPSGLMVLGQPSARHRDLAAYHVRCFAVAYDRGGFVRDCNFLEGGDTPELEAALLRWASAKHGADAR